MVMKPSKIYRNPRPRAEEVILSGFAAVSGINANTARKERAKKANRIFASWDLSVDQFSYQTFALAQTFHVSSLEISPLLFLLYKKNFLLSNTLFNIYIYIYNSIKHFNFTFSPYIHMLFSKLFQKIPKIPRSISCIFFLFFIFLQRSRYSILKRFSMSLNLDTISSSIFSLVSRSREGEKRTKPGNLGTWRVGSGGVSLAPPLPSSLPRFARCWPYAFLPRSRCCTWLELG